MMNISDTRDCAFEAFITNLGKYNEGFLVGEWVKSQAEKQADKILRYPN